jgi:XisH protein
MPQYDLHHAAVRRALEKDGWTITDDPFIIAVGRRRLLADLGAEKRIDLPSGMQKVVVEIKVLGGESLVNDLHRALGQYQNYRSLLRYLKSERKLYLAIPRNVYEKEFGDEMVQAIISDQQIFLLIFDPEKEEILQWINPQS